MEKETIIIQKIRDGGITEKTDEVAVEYTFEIPLKNGNQICVTCTPTYIEEMILSRRFLAKDFTEEELRDVTGCGSIENTLDCVNLKEIFCVAGKFFENPGALFLDTGCAHSCALIFEGEVVCCIEDIGRHNALDKVIGYALKHRIPFSGSYIFTSGRVSEDYLQKAIAAGFPMVVSRAAVTKAAVDLARREGVTLFGFVRKNTGNIYYEGKVKLYNDLEEVE